MRISNPPRLTSSLVLISRETLVTNKQLQNSDSQIQDLINSTGFQLNLFLPTSPTLGKSFVFINQDISTGNFLVNNTIIPPGDRYSIIWNGDRWIEL